MRSRNIKPGFFENEHLASLPYETRLLFIGLWCIADREGRFEWRTKRIKALIFPYDNINIECHLMSLHAMTLILQYKVGNVPYGMIINFKKHQHPHPHEARSTIPSHTEGEFCKIYYCEKSELNQCHDMSLNVTKCKSDIRIPDIMITGQKNPGPESEEPKNKKTKDPVQIFQKPTIDEISEYCTERKNGIDPDAFFHFYESKNWMIGKNKMKSWKSAVITWEKGRKAHPGPTYKQQQIGFDCPILA